VVELTGGDGVVFWGLARTAGEPVRLFLVLRWAWALFAVADAVCQLARVDKAKDVFGRAVEPKNAVLPF